MPFANSKMTSTEAAATPVVNGDEKKPVEAEMKEDVVAEQPAATDGEAKKEEVTEEQSAAANGDAKVQEEEAAEEVDVDGLLAQGKRDFYCGEYVNSVSAMQKVCETLAKKHGEMADEIAEPYLLYGKALLEVARMESDVLGNALDGIPEDQDQEAATPTEANDIIEKDSLTEEEKEKISEQVIDAMTEDDSADKKAEAEDADMPDAVDQKDNDVETKEEKPAEKEVAEKKEEVAEKKEEVEEKKEKVEEKKEEVAEKKEKVEEKTNETDAKDSEGGDADGEEGEEEEEEEDEEEEEEEEEDVGNLQIAWEVLEVARSIFSRQENWSRLAESHVCLAEVGMEKEDWTQAEEDLQSAISIYTEKVKVDKGDRRLATAYFQLAVASLADKKYADSKRAFDDSIGHLQARASKANDELKTGPTDERKAELEKELKDLDELIEELRERIVEVDEERIDFEMMRKQLRAGVSSMSGNASSSSNGTTTTSADTIGNGTAEPADGVNDISGLVRKKRKVEEPVEGAAPSPSKRQKTTDQPDTNGTNAAESAPAAAATNGTTVHPDADMPLATEKQEEKENEAVAASDAAAVAPKAKTVEDVQKLTSEQQQQAA